MLSVIFVIFIIWIAATIIIEYLKSTRIKREKQKFEKFKTSIHQKGLVERESLLRQSQHSNIKELGLIVRERLNEFSMDIPPRLFQKAQNSIDQYVDDIEFNQLYELYQILVNTRKNLVFQELNNFFKWGYLK